MRYQKLDDQEYERVWDEFEARFEFKPDYYNLNEPAIKEPAQSIIFSWRRNLSAEDVDALEQVILEAFSELTPDQGIMYALDWQHESYKFDPHNDYRGMPIPIFPDGDYSIFLNSTMDMGTFAHPWQETICIFGRDLVNIIEAKLPFLYARVERRSPQPSP